MLGLLDAILWSLRKSQRDVVRMYEQLSPLMCRITGCSMLNFGYWDDTNNTPALAQENMCSLMADVAELGNGADMTVLDVGSGFCAPALYWTRCYRNLEVCCINTSYRQLLEAALQSDWEDDGGGSRGHGNSGGGSGATRGNINQVSASATALPSAAGSADRIIALESAQHFKPLGLFASECRRAISESGILVVALPVVAKRAASARLGILNFTWASEHYSLGHVRKTIRGGGFEVVDEQLVGRSVYEPLADYYEAHRPDIRQSVGAIGCPSHLEGVIAASMRRMRSAACAGALEYAILKCRPR